MVLTMVWRRTSRQARFTSLDRRGAGAYVRDRLAATVLAFAFLLRAVAGALADVVTRSPPGLAGRRSTLVTPSTKRVITARASQVTDGKVAGSADFEIYSEGETRGSSSFAAARTRAQGPDRRREDVADDPRGSRPFRSRRTSGCSAAPRWRRREHASSPRITPRRCGPGRGTRRRQALPGRWS